MSRVDKRPPEASATEVTEKAVRRTFTADYKLKVLKDADACNVGDGKLGQLLRQEGLYSSHLLTWRKQRDEGSLAALEPKKRGRKPTKSRDPVRVELEQLKREHARLQHRLQQAEAIIEVQKKLSQILGLSLPTLGTESGRSE